MKRDARLYQCVSCHKQCLICSECDRGNIYCLDGCADIARRKSCRAANQRYQNTSRAKTLHAARQKRYRNNLKQKVTDHGSNKQPQNALLRKVKNEAEEVVFIHESEALRCCCCHKVVPSHLRRDFIQQNRRKNTHSANTS